MKKSVLVTSILFSTMMLGTGVSNNGTNDVKASEITKLGDKDVVKNRIMFIDQNGSPVSPYVHGYPDPENYCYTLSGKIGEDINLEPILSKGYELRDKEREIKYALNDGITTVYINAKDTVNVVNFIDMDGKKLNTISLRGKVGDKKPFKYGIPNGYHFLRYMKDSLTLSFKSGEIDFLIDKDKGNKVVNINFVDESGNPISTSKKTYPIGEEVDLESYDFKLPEDYRLADDQSLSFFVNDADDVTIKVKKYIFTNNVELKDGDKIVKTFKVKGEYNESVNILDCLPKEYGLLNSEDKDITIGEDEKHVAVNVKKNTLTYVIEFKDSMGKVVGKDKIEGMEGSERNIESIIPNNYSFKSEDDKYIELKDNSKTISIGVLKNNVKKIIEFKDSKGNVVGKDEIEGDEGSQGYFDLKVPNNYFLKDDSAPDIKIENNDEPITINVLKNNVKKTIRFKDSKGKVLGTTEIEGREGEKNHFSLKAPNNYSFKDDEDPFVRIEDNDEPININVFKNNLKKTIELIDIKGKLVGIVEIEANEGTDYHINDYDMPEHYYLLNGRENKIQISDDDKNISLIVCKKIMNRIHYMAPDGSSITGFYGDYEVLGKDGEEKRIRQIPGYDILGAKEIKINSKDGYIHTVNLKGRKISTELIFKEIEHYNDKPVLTVEHSGIVGDRIPLKYVPEGYVLDNVEDRLAYQVPTQNVLIRKMVKTKVNYVDSFGKVIGKEEFTKPDGNYVKLSAPKGYLLVNNPYKALKIDRDIPVQNVLVVPTNGVQMPELPNIVSTQINLINRKDNKVIHSYVAQGIHGQSMNIQIPTGYDLAKGVTDKLTLDKSKKLVNIYMVEKETTNTTGVTVPHSKTVLTKQTAHLYDKNGNKVTNRALGSNSGWKSDQMMVLNGETYYRVATNEYVKVSDIVEYQMDVSTVKTTSGSAKYLYDVNGKKSSDRALAANTAWFTDKSAMINGEKMYRVATNEWVKASDIN